MPHLSLSLLGAFEVTLDGEPIKAFGSDKARALLAFLAIESARPHRRAKLAGMFWSDLEEKRAAHNLSQTLLRLRRALREPKLSAQATHQPFLLLSRQNIQFNPHSDYRLDVALFTELLWASEQHHHPDAQTCAVCRQWLHQAASLYRGEMLEGFFLHGSVGFEEWQLVQQEMLHRQAVETLARLATYHEARSEHELVQHYAGQLVALEPWHEQGHFQLMQALARGGRTATALEQFAIYRRILDEEFDLPPSAEATALVEQIQTGQVGRDVASRPAPGRPTTGGVSSAAQSDLRQVTALIYSAAAGADPEEMHRRLARLGSECQATIERYGGHLQSRQGDEYLIYFGYPQAYEDTARRAVHAGLAMVRDADWIRVGIHTGLMVTSGDYGPGAESRGPIGNAPKVARGCQALAEPGTVLITADTERLVRGWFRCQKMGLRTIQGLADPVEVYRVLGESDAQSRLDWLARVQNLPLFVGREPELDRLLSFGNEIRSGDGQAILIGGEPGIGKSRLVWEFKTRLLEKNRAETVNWLESHCSPYFQNTSLYPLISLLEQLLGFETSDSPEVKRDKLDGALARCDLAHPAASWLLSLLLGLPTEAPTPQTITADQRERMREMLVVLLQKQAALQPLVVVIEDLHWSDPTTVEWLGRSFDALAAVPCLVLLTCRPMFISPWLPRPHLLSLTLGPLDPAQAESLVTNVAGDRSLPGELRQRIVGQTDGVPLFVEELTKTILDQQATEAAKTPRFLQIPATLRDSLMARLDHAGAAKETAQWAAVLGRGFSYPILRAVVPYDERHLQDDLEALAEADLVHVQNRTPQVYFSFKHSLIQEAAYASLLRRTRQDHHRRIAETLENRFPQVAETQPEVLAEHYASAGLQTLAIDFWLRAGERATAQGATLEAKSVFGRAMEWIEPGDAARRWQALWGRETALCFRGERAAQKADITALLDLAESLDDDTRRAQAQMRKARYASSQADYPVQLEAADAAIAAADRAGVLTLEVEALAYKVTALLRLGDRAAVHQAVERTLAKVQEAKDDSVRAYANAAVALYYVEVGDLARAAQFLSQSLEASRRAKTRDLNLESQYHGHLGFTYAQLGLYAQARDTLKVGLDLANMMGTGRYQAYNLLNLGFVYWRTDDLNKAVQMEKEALEEYSQTGEAFGQAACQAYLGYIHETAGDRNLAEEYLAKACAGFAELGVDPDKFEAQAVAARVALAQGRQEEARQSVLEVWKYLCEHGTEGLGAPVWVYVCLADVLEAVEVPGISAREVIEAGYRELMQHAEKISKAEWRRSFLEKVTENREIVMRWKELNTGSHSGD